MLLAPRGDPVQFRSKGLSIPSEKGEVWAWALITLLSSKAVGGAVLRFFSGRGVEFSGVRSATAAALLLRLRMAAPSSQPSAASLNWGAPLSWGVRAQPSHTKNCGQNCQGQDLCALPAPLKLKDTKEKWLDFLSNHYPYSILIPWHCWWALPGDIINSCC